MKVLLLNLSTSGIFIGVDRYLEALCNYLSCQGVEVTWVDFRINHSACNIQLVRDSKYLSKILVPLPQNYGVLLKNFGKMVPYGKHIVDFLRRQGYLPSTIDIIHLQSPNLASIASELRSVYPQCKLITHIHSISWKGLINEHSQLFNRLYSEYYHQNKTLHTRVIGEDISVYKSNSIICLTKCAYEFISRIYPSTVDRIRIIPNGLSDWGQGTARAYNAKEQCRLIFVGTLSKGKGLDFILEAMNIAQERGVRLAIDVAGTCSDSVKKGIYSRYPELSISLHGRVERDELIALYRRADIGVIASLQEQCSYAAIEMCMMGLPIITTAVDGLDEMFEDEVNALKVPVHFSRIRGLFVDVDYYAQCLVRLTQNERLRANLGQSARLLYLSHYTLEQMGGATMSLYGNLQRIV